MLGIPPPATGRAVISNSVISTTSRSTIRRGSTDVTIDSLRAPGSITFANSVDYSFSGTGGIVGSGDINVTGSGNVALGNEGNNFTGTTTVNAGSNLRLAAASTGSINNSGTLSLGC